MDFQHLEIQVGVWQHLLCPWSPSSKGRCAGCKISLKIRGGSRGSSRTSPGALEFAGGASGESAPRCFVHPGYFASRQQLAKLQHFDPSARHRKNPSPSRPPRGAVPSPPAAPRQMCLLFTPLPGFWVTNSLTPRSQPSPEGMFEFVLSAGSGPSSPSRQVEEEEAGNLNFSTTIASVALGRSVFPPACPQYVSV